MEDADPEPGGIKIRNKTGYLPEVKSERKEQKLGFEKYINLLLS